MATVIVLSHNAQNPLTENNRHAMTTAIRTHTLEVLSHKAENSLTTANDHQTTK
jgi:hypothetical protein